MSPQSKALLRTILGMTLLVACDNAQEEQEQLGSRQGGPTLLQTPEAISIEHRELHEMLGRAVKEGGDTGRAAVELERVLAPHFEREEQIATPPLGLLPALAQGEPTAEMRSVLPMTLALEREMPKMLEEHDAIREAVAKFRATAERDGKPDYVRFADNLAAHARQEEQILYPSAILVGRYVARTVPDR